jgi:hypothetical protein
MVRKLDLYEITSAFLSLADGELMMPRVLDSFRFVLIAVAGRMNQRQLQIIDYLREDNRVLREQLGGRRVRFNDDQRRRLAAKAKRLGRIQGALSNLGYEIARSTIAEILERHGIEPAPERSRKTTWEEFLSRHWEIGRNLTDAVQGILNAHVERFVRTIKESCLERMILFGEESCITSLGHHHTERNHQGLANQRSASFRGPPSLRGTAEIH